MTPPATRKILYVITKSNWGGAQRYVYDLATSLPRSKFSVSVALGGKGDLNRKLQEAGIHTFSLENLDRNLALRADIRGFISLYRTIRSFRPDIVHLNSSKAGGLGALAARLCGVSRIIFTAHGWPFLEQRNVFWRLFALLGSYATALLSDTVIVVSKNDLRIGCRMPFCARKMKLVYNGVDEHMTFGSGETIRAAFPPHATIVGTVGELTKNKNQEVLIEEARENEDTYVAIVGEGEDRERLEQKIAKYGLGARVKLFGFMPAADVLRGFDVFALPSRKEGLPYVLLEARLAGLPIRANRIGGVSDILDSKDLKDFSLTAMVAKTTALYR